MQQYSEEVRDKHKIRKRKRQKIDFIKRTEEELTKDGYWVEIQVGGITRNRNIVVGDPRTADIILTAHYDTCARMPVPNICTPKNILFYVLYNLFIVGIMLCVASLFGWLWEVSNLPILSGESIQIIVLLVCIILLYIGPSNTNNFNDNTSGVLTLLETASKLPDNYREKVAFVFFDHEELGLFGSKLFAKQYSEVRKNTLLVNFDCISDGDHILIVHKKSVRQSKDYEILTKYLTSTSDKKVVHMKASNTLYPSDHSWFKRSVGVLATKKVPMIGYYLGRIHTSRDTKLDERNIELLSDSMVEVIKEL